MGMGQDIKHKHNMQSTDFDTPYNGIYSSLQANLLRNLVSKALLLLFAERTFQAYLGSNAQLIYSSENTDSVIEVCE